MKTVGNGLTRAKGGFRIADGKTGATVCSQSAMAMKAVQIMRISGMENEQPKSGCRNIMRIVFLHVEPCAQVTIRLNANVQFNSIQFSIQFNSKTLIIPQGAILLWS